MNEIYPTLETKTGDEAIKQAGIPFGVSTELEIDEFRVPR
jgi:hypothetical protein